jgi:hypothetical protein
MTNITPQSSRLDTANVSCEGSDATGSRGQEQKQQQTSSNNVPRDIMCLSQLSLQEAEDDGEDMTSSTRRRLQWQWQQESCREFAAQSLAPAQPPTEGLLQSTTSSSDAVIKNRRSSFHYNLHSKLHGLFKDDKNYTNTMMP